MRTLAKKMERFAAFTLTALTITAVLAATASAATYTWTGLSTATPPPANLYWSDLNNWAPNVVPPVGSDITFAQAGAVNTTATTNEVDANFSNSINSLWYSQQGDPSTTNEVHTTVIDQGVTLRITGNTALPTSPISIGGSNGNYSLMAGSYGSSTTTQSHTYISGNGTLDVSANGNGIGNTNGDIIVRESQSGGGSTQNSTLNMSGLAVFSANVDQLLVGVNSTATSGSGERASGVLYLAQSNTITMNNTGTSYNAGLILGYVAHNAGNTTYLYLGQTNVLNVDNVTIGGKRMKGNVYFNTTKFTYDPAVTALTMRGVSATRVANIVIGDNGDLTTSSTTSTATGLLDLRGGKADILAASIVLGRGPLTATDTTHTDNGGAGTLYLDTGTIDTTAVTVGDQLTNWNAANTGTINISGTGNLLVNNPATGSAGGSFVLGYRASALTVGSSTGTLNITGGTVGLGCDITDGGGTSTVSLDNTTHTGTGTLDMGLGGVGHNIGSAANPIDTLTFASGTLKNVAGINSVTDGTTMNKTTAGTLILDGTNTYTGNTKVTAGTLKFASSVTIASNTIDISAGILDVTAFGGPGYVLAAGKTLKGNGTVTGFVDVLGGIVSPGESAGMLNVADMTFDNASTLSIELNGTGAGQFDVLNSTGVLALQGASTLAVTLGYTPASGDSFDIMNWGTLAGPGFGTLSLPALPDGLTWDTSNLYTSGSIAIVPEPAALAMLIIAAGLCLVFKRFRNK